MISFTKEQLIASAHARIEFAEMMLAGELEPLKERTWSIELELASIALASLEAEPVLYAAEETLVYSKHGELHLTCLSEPMGDAVIPLYTAPPAPVSVTDELAKRIPEILRTGKANRWEIQALAKGCRAAMLQGVEPVTTAYKLPFEQWLSQQTGTIDVECGCVMTEVFFHWLRVAYEAGNSPVTPGGWVKCSERMPDPDSKFRVCAYTPSPHEDLRFRFVPASLFKSVCRDATHWQYMPLPAAPHQE
ncbi:DUF551 domain-containing protein [Enterobacter hormaechei]|uniref:DUF551 domain-containing protein n=1 Tax=Enterobacter hormaechei TaxID=158836 RepID=UPI002FF2600F